MICFKSFLSIFFFSEKNLKSSKDFFGIIILICELFPIKMY